MADSNREVAKRTALPACCDIFEEDGRVVLTLEMPGVSKENLEIHVEGDELRISGRKDRSMWPEGNYMIHEIRDADFVQKYTLDDTIDREKIEATLTNGIVHLSLGLKESVKPKKIEIKAK